MNLGHISNVFLVFQVGCRDTYTNLQLVTRLVKPSDRSRVTRLKHGSNLTKEPNFNIWNPWSHQLITKRFRYQKMEGFLNLIYGCCWGWGNSLPYISRIHPSIELAETYIGFWYLHLRVPEIFHEAYIIVGHILDFFMDLEVFWYLHLRVHLSLLPARWTHFPALMIVWLHTWNIGMSLGRRARIGDLIFLIPRLAEMNSSQNLAEKSQDFFKKKWYLMIHDGCSISMSV